MAVTKQILGPRNICKTELRILHFMNAKGNEYCHAVKHSGIKIPPSICLFGGENFLGFKIDLHCEI